MPRFATVNGVRLAYDRVGHGFPILLVHGFPRRRGSPLMSGFLPKTPAARHGHQDEQQQSSAERGGDGRAPDLSDQAGRQRAETPRAPRRGHEEAHHPTADTV